MKIIGGLLREWRDLSLLLAALFAFGDALAVGGISVPSLTNVSITSSVTHDQTQGYFVYRYAVGSEAQNSGRIFQIVVDVSAPRGYALPPENGTFLIPTAAGARPFAEFRNFFALFADFKKNRGIHDDEFAGTLHVPFGQAVPAGWVGGLTIDGGAMFLLSDGAQGIDPGMTQEGFELRSHGLPTLRDFRVSPYWIHAVEDHDAVTDEERIQAARIEANLDVAVVALGPGWFQPGSAQHWNAVRDDLARMRDLGWIADAAWGDAVAMLLAQARSALEAQDAALVRQRLQEMQASVDGSTTSQRRGEVADHLRENLRFLIDATNVENPEQPGLTLSPARTSAQLGEEREFVLRVVDLANGSRPLADKRIRFDVAEGPNAGISESFETDAEGYARFAYRGTRQGIDRVVASCRGYETDCEAEAKALWLGGADLVVPLFIPPLLETEGNRSFRLTESTTNIGNAAAPESTTRYYIAAAPIADVGQARVLAERSVPALTPGEEHEVGPVTYQIPGDLPAGRYYLAACADAAGAVAEKDENNNCSFNEIPGNTSVILPAESPLRPPDCAAAVASPAVLWPPNHRMMTIEIAGVTHPDGRPFEIGIGAITQDEPVNDMGDGNTSPDGAGVGTPKAQVRAERAGPGNGCVYRISFTATDDLGASCEGAVMVGVPHDQRPGSAAIDDGQNHDATTETAKGGACGKHPWQRC